MIILALYFQHMRIRSAEGEQLVVGSALFDFSVFEKQNRIAEPCRREAVRDEERSLIFQQGAVGFVHFIF